MYKKNVSIIALRNFNSMVRYYNEFKITLKLYLKYIGIVICKNNKTSRKLFKFLLLPILAIVVNSYRFKHVCKF